LIMDQETEYTSAHILSIQKYTFQSY